jgi:hypothetical protein
LGLVSTWMGGRPNDKCAVRTLWDGVGEDTGRSPSDCLREIWQNASSEVQEQIIKSIGRAHTTGENGEWGETKQRSERLVAFNSVPGPS